MSILVYLRLAVDQKDVPEFERDLAQMDALARAQPGFIWSETLRSPDATATYVILSEWEARDHSRAWEHSPRHEEIMDKWGKRYAQAYKKRRFTSM